MLPTPTFIHIRGISDFYHFITEQNINDYPLLKILYSANRRDYIKTILIITPSRCIQYKTELRIYGLSGSGKEFHFFSEEIEPEDSIDKYKKAYKGFAYIRDNNTVSYSMISDNVITRPNDHYCCICNRLTKEVKIFADLPALSITGYPYMEKDMGLSMCAQVSIKLATDYWNYIFGFPALPP